MAGILHLLPATMIEAVGREASLPEAGAMEIVKEAVAGAARRVVHQGRSALATVHATIIPIQTAGLRTSGGIRYRHGARRVQEAAMAVAGAGAAGAAISRSCMESQCGKINFVGSERRGLPAPAFRLIAHADWCLRVNRDENLRFSCEERQRGLRG